MLAYKLVKWKFLSQQKLVAEDQQKGSVAMQSLQFDLLFTYFIIADINSGLKNYLYAEIAPRTIYPLYGISYQEFISWFYAINLFDYMVILYA